MNEPLTLIDLFALPGDAVTAAVNGWAEHTRPLTDAPGARGARLHRAVSAESPHQIVNVAQWDSTEQWQAALSTFQPPAERRRQAETNGVTARPSFYRVVSVLTGPEVAASAE